MAPVLRHVESLLLVAVLVCSFFAVARTLVRIHAPYQMDYAEGTILNTALRLSQGGSLYQPIQTLPYHLDPYPPFIYKLVSVLIVRYGLDFYYPRLIVMIAAIVACLFAALLIRQWTGEWKLAIAFGMLPLTVGQLQAWLGILRYDLIGIGLTMIGLAIFVLLPRFRCWAIPFFVLAVAGLYTLVGAPAACCLFLWGRGERKASVLFGASFSIVLIAGYLYGQHVTNGAMGYHLFKTQHSPYSLSQLASFTQGYLRSYALLAVLSAGVVWKAIREKKLSLILFYWVLVAGTSLTLGKVGASQNHMLHFIFVACVAAGVAYAWLRQDSRAESGLMLVVATLIVTTLANAPLRIKKPIEDLSGCGQAYAAVKSDLGDRILSDNVGALVFADKPTYISDPFVYRWLVMSGGYPDNELRRMIESRQFSSIVLDNRPDRQENDGGRWPDAVRLAIQNNYQLKQEFVCNDARFVYQPKQSSSPTSQASANGASSFPLQTNKNRVDP